MMLVVVSGRVVELPRISSGFRSRVVVAGGSEVPVGCKWGVSGVQVIVGRLISDPMIYAVKYAPRLSLGSFELLP